MDSPVMDPENFLKGLRLVTLGILFDFDEIWH
jgi:hypothetical protein